MPGMGWGLSDTKAELPPQSPQTAPNALSDKALRRNAQGGSPRRPHLDHVLEVRQIWHRRCVADGPEAMPLSALVAEIVLPEHPPSGARRRVTGRDECRPRGRHGGSIPPPSVVLPRSRHARARSPVRAHRPSHPPRTVRRVAPVPMRVGRRRRMAPRVVGESPRAVGPRPARAAAHAGRVVRGARAEVRHRLVAPRRLRSVRHVAAGAASQAAGQDGGPGERAGVERAAHDVLPDSLELGFW